MPRIRGHMTFAGPSGGPCVGVHVATPRRQGGGSGEHAQSLTRGEGEWELRGGCSGTPLHAPTPPPTSASASIVCHHGSLPPLTPTSSPTIDNFHQKPTLGPSCLPTAPSKAMGVETPPGEETLVLGHAERFPALGLAWEWSRGRLMSRHPSSSPSPPHGGPGSGGTPPPRGW